MKYQVRVYKYDNDRASRLAKTDAIDKAYGSVPPTDPISELINDLNIENLYEGQILSTQKELFEVKKIVPQIYDNKTKNLVVYIKETTTRKIKR